MEKTTMNLQRVEDALNFYGWNQYDLDRKANVSLGATNKMFQRKGRIGRKSALKIAKALGLKLDDILVLPHYRPITLEDLSE